MSYGLVLSSGVSASKGYEIATFFQKEIQNCNAKFLQIHAEGDRR